MDLVALVVLGAVTVTAASTATNAMCSRISDDSSSTCRTLEETALLQAQWREAQSLRIPAKIEDLVLKLALEDVHRTAVAAHRAAAVPTEQHRVTTALQAAAVEHHDTPLATLQQPVEWNFTKGDPEAIKQWIAWDRAEGWSSPSRPGVNLSNKEVWPDLKGAPKGWNFGLADPQVFVLSMPLRATRRQRFKQQIESLCLSADLHWAPALDGSRIPPELRWMNGFVDKQSWDYSRPGNWACYASHLAILRQAHAACPTCDVVVFEDDIVFAPDFKKRWASFLSALPSDWDLLRIGGQSQWEPPFEITADYIRAKAVSNTWGYVVRARSVDSLAKLLAEMPIRGNWGIDAVFQLFSKDLPMYSPLVPLVFAASECHDTEKLINKEGCETAETLRKSERRLYEAWPLGYARTYCRSPSDLRAPGREHCVANTSDACCPYVSPPRGMLSGSPNTC